MGLDERTLLPGHVREWGHHGGLQGVRSILVGPVDFSFAVFQKNNSHHEGLQGVKIVLVHSDDDLRPSATP